MNDFRQGRFCHGAKAQAGERYSELAGGQVKVQPLFDDQGRSSEQAGLGELVHAAGACPHRGKLSRHKVRVKQNQRQSRQYPQNSIPRHPFTRTRRRGTMAQRHSIVQYVDVRSSGQAHSPSPQQAVAGRDRSPDRGSPRHPVRRRPDVGGLVAMGAAHSPAYSLRDSGDTAAVPLLQLRRLPGTLIAAMEVDRQSGSADLLSTATTIGSPVPTIVEQAIIYRARQRASDIDLSRFVAGHYGIYWWVAVLVLAGLVPVFRVPAHPVTDVPHFARPLLAPPMPRREITARRPRTT